MSYIVTRRIFLSKLVATGGVLVAGSAFLAACGDNPTAASTTTTAVTTTAAASTTIAAVSVVPEGFADFGVIGDFSSATAPSKVSLDTIKKGMGNGYVVKDGNNFIVVGDVCTHQGCEVAYNAAQNNFTCPCHGSEYSLTGANVKGPAKLPLARYETRVDKGRLFVALKPMN